MCGIGLVVEAKSEEVAALIDLLLFLVSQPGDASGEEGVDTEGLAWMKAWLLDILASASSRSISVLCFRNSSPCSRKTCISRPFPQTAFLQTAARNTDNSCTLGAHICLCSLTFSVFACVKWIILELRCTPGLTVQGSRAGWCLGSGF